jgi:hypothetical protein
MILNIHNFNGQALVTHQHIHSPELLHVFKQFFLAAEQRNEQLKDLVNKLQSPNYIVDKKCLLETLILSQQETEIDIELVRKLMP